MIRKILFPIILLPFISFSQNFEKANKDYSLLNYDEAIHRYEKQIAKAKTPEKISVSTLENLANSYYYKQDYKNAKDYYKRVYDLKGSDMLEVDFIRYLSALRSVNNMRKADQLFDEYYKNDKTKLKVRDYQKKQLDSLETSYNRVLNLDVNTSQSDFGVALYNKEVVFSSNRGDNQTGYFNIYKADRNPNSGQIYGAKKYLENLNSNYNDATFSFHKENNIVFFSRNYITKKGKLDVDRGENSRVMIMRGRIDGNEIVEVEPLAFNDKNYNCSHPFVSPDGKSLFFSSDMPGGYGGADIYVAELYNDGTVGKPVNLGETINTPGSELFPSMTGDTLFFSSDFHYGLGGLDIFSSVMKGVTNFSVPENLGEPINSNGDDFAFLRLNDRTGYFSSNRVGGVGSDDIYWFGMDELITDIDYSGIVLSKGDSLPIPEAKIKVYDKFGELAQEIESDETGAYKLVLPTNSQFKVVFSKEEYSTEEANVSTPEKAEDSEDNDIFLTAFASLVEKEGEDEKIKVDPIYFDYDAWEITPKAEEELDKVLYALNSFPNIKIKIESHTDSRGADAYNLNLSDKRAKSTEEYLISKGVDPERIISAQGYGETKLLNGCKNGVNCTEEEHSVNRRSNFIIVQK